MEVEDVLFRSVFFKTPSFSFMLDLVATQEVLVKTLYKIGDVVPQHGMYMCIPCGYVQEFQVNDLFTTCELCLAGTDEGPDEYTEAEVEFWELLG